MTLRKTPNNMNRVPFLIFLQNEDAGSFGETGIVFEDQGFRNACNDLAS